MSALFVKRQIECCDMRTAEMRKICDLHTYLHAVTIGMLLVLAFALHRIHRQLDTIQQHVSTVISYTEPPPLPRWWDGMKNSKDGEMPEA